MNQFILKSGAESRFYLNRAKNNINPDIDEAYDEQVALSPLFDHLKQPKTLP